MHLTLSRIPVTDTLNQDDILWIFALTTGFLNELDIRIDIASNVSLEANFRAMGAITGNNF